MLLRAKDHPIPPRTTKEEVQVDREKRYKVDLFSPRPPGCYLVIEFSKWIPNKAVSKVWLLN